MRKDVSVELMEVGALNLASSLTASDFNVKGDTVPSYELTHNSPIHMLRITVQCTLHSVSQPIIPLADVKSYSLFMIKTEFKYLFNRPLDADLLSLILDCAKIAIAHNRGMYEAITNNTILDILRPFTPTSPILIPKIRADIDKFLFDPQEIG